MKNNPKYIILFISICTLVLLCFACTASAQTTVVKAEASSNQPHVGETLTVEIKISNVQNLFGLDVTLNWNPSVLKVITATPQLGVESHAGGVLHESTTYPIEVVNDDVSQSIGEYHLMATSTGSTTPAFSGSGTIATITFNVTNTGPTGLTLTSELSDKAPADGNANLIDHTDTVTSVNAIPEFPPLTIMLLVVILASVVLAASIKRLRYAAPSSIVKSR
ncbi:MAG: cohesin domain-containing protein [Candidatus Bathyarchaeota archaeon]|nr:cohesin domain-containing protein [Candidatus Bathyarchaeota archaeon]